MVRELGRRDASVVRFNTERARDWRLTLQPGEWWELRGDQRALRSEECVGVWFRRPEVPDTGVEGAAAEAVADQWRAFVTGLASVPGPTWVSDPGHIRSAENKAVQLRAAREVGLQVPETLWTNDLAGASRFVETNRRTAVVKSVATAWWEDAGQGHFVYASLVGPEDLPSATSMAGAPVCLQRPIWPKRDVRVTVVGGAVLGAIRAAGDDDEALDWRRELAGEWLPYELPDGVASSCRSLVAQLSLQFSGIDLARDESGRHWFLELNPNGEWGWLQRAGLPIAEALADVLLSPV